MLNRFKRFREYLIRSITKPYNFYADIRDQRIISSFQTYMLGALVSLTIGAYLSSVFYYYRASETAQYIYMFVFPLGSLQETFYELVWRPELMTLAIALISFIGAFAVAFAIKIFAFLSRAKIFFNDTFIIAIWGGSPFLFLLPIALFLFRALVVYPGFIWTALIAFAFIGVWSFFRILRASAVVFDVKSAKVYAIGLAVVFVVAAAILSFYQLNYSIIPYALYLKNAMLQL